MQSRNLEALEERWSFYRRTCLIRITGSLNFGIILCSIISNSKYLGFYWMARMNFLTYFSLESGQTVAFITFLIHCAISTRSTIQACFLILISGSLYEFYRAYPSLNKKKFPCSKLKTRFFRINFLFDWQVFGCSQNSPEWLILQKHDSSSSPSIVMHFPFPLHKFSLQVPLQAHLDGFGSHLSPFNSDKSQTQIVPSSPFIHVSYWVHPG